MPGDASHRLCLRCLLGFGLKDAGPAIPDEESPGQPDAELAQLGRTFDRYRLIEKLGEGGCGVVYRAEQFEPIRRQVAVKVIKLGMDSRNVIARFEAERQALAIMDHPGIARIFDGGVTTAGRPYFVMELVPGERLTDYCRHRGTSLEHRLRLFVDLCHAVQHAHQKGIIHRDLKPSNVLVVEENGSARPKVIDFGVARATARQRLADDTIYTAFDQFVGTPAYMSPEQAGLPSEDVDTRTDIYSLGVLLYELLTGVPPFDPRQLRSAALHEVCRIIREEEPMTPSTRLRQDARSSLFPSLSSAALAKEDEGERGTARHLSLATCHSPLPADLDWIVMKALEKDPSRRYETANALATDVERSLQNEPVLARPPSAGYRLSKVIRRHRATAFAVLLAVLALVIATIVSTAMAIRARRADAEKSRLLQQARQEAEAGQHVISLLNDTYNHWRPAGGRRQHTLAWTEVVETLRHRAEASSPEQQPLIRRMLFLMIQGDHFSWSGDLPDAETLTREALNLSTGLPPGNEDLRAGISECLALVLRRMNRPDDARRLFASALELRQRFQSSDPTAVQASYAFTYATEQARERGELPLAETMGRLHVAALRQKFGSTNLAAAEALLSFGRTLAAESKTNEAQAIYREAIDAMRTNQISPDDPEIAEIRQEYVRALDAVATYFLATGNLEESASFKAEAESRRSGNR